MAQPVDPPYLVALNLTRRCNLRCAHCYLDAGARRAGDPDEMTTEEVTDLLDGIAALSDETMVVFTGGEPLLRRDLTELVAYASGLGLMAVLGTNGVLLDDHRVRALRDAGLQGAGISLDSLDAAKHDAFRGREGSWAGAMAAIDSCRRNDLRFQIHFSVTDDNAGELDDMIAFAESAGAFALNVFFLVCTGRGERVSNISRAVYDATLQRIVAAAHAGGPLLVRAKCAPHFKRMAMQHDPSWAITTAQGYDAGGCLAGTRYCRVTPDGGVTACPYMDETVGSVRDSLFAEIWRDAPQFQALRRPALEGRCGACEYTRLCGGCRARPLARDGNAMGEDFLCGYQPAGGAVIEPFASDSAALRWSAEAEAWLHRVPPFVRRFVRRRAEAHVRAAGGHEVTADVMTALARKRFGGRGIPGIGGRGRR